MSENKKKVRALIVDDESLARQTIRDLLSEDSEVEVIGECGGGLEAVNFIRRQTPDLLFLDIQMPGMNGFETLREIEAVYIPAIIFVTAYDGYALKAFEVHALDYLLKPFSDRRFEEALRQAKAHIEMKEVRELSQSLLALLGEQTGRAPAEAGRKPFLRRFKIKSDGRVIFIKAADVDWISAEDYYVKLHIGAKTLLLRMSMNELEETLDPKGFLRIHRSVIVNFDRVKELRQHPNGEYVVVLTDGTELKLSRSRRERLEQLLTNDGE